jgi:hypothetical protein
MDFEVLIVVLDVLVVFFSCSSIVFNIDYEGFGKFSSRVDCWRCEIDSIMRDLFKIDSRSSARSF